MLKFAAHFCLANQFTQQIPEKVRAAVLDNAGSLIVFCVSASDAKLLAPEVDKLPPSEMTDQYPFTAWIRRGNSGTYKDHGASAPLSAAWAPREGCRTKPSELRPAKTHDREGRGMVAVCPLRGEAQATALTCTTEHRASRVIEMRMQFSRRYISRRLVENAFDSALGERVVQGNDKRLSHACYVPPHLYVCSFLAVNNEPVSFENSDHVFA